MAKVDYDVNLDVNGDITLSGTVDGRDIASDGIKLDGVDQQIDDKITVHALDPTPHINATSGRDFAALFQNGVT